jgi:hypothetical protein
LLVSFLAFLYSFQFPILLHCHIFIGYVTCLFVLRKSCEIWIATFMFTTNMVVTMDYF